MLGNARLAATAASLAILCCSTPALAQVTFTSTAFDTGVPAGQTMVDDFDSPIAAGYTFTGENLQTGLTPGYSAAPAGDTSTYNAVTADTFAVLTSSALMSSMSIYLGSLDSYNYIGFLGPNGTLQNVFSGSQLVANANGDQQSGATNRLFNFAFTSPVDEVVFGSLGNSFEFDNIAVQTVSSSVSAAPEPSSWALMMLAVGGMGYALRRARKNGGLTVATVSA